MITPAACSNCYGSGKDVAGNPCNCGLQPVPAKPVDAIDQLELCVRECVKRIGAKNTMDRVQEVCFAMRLEAEGMMVTFDLGKAQTLDDEKLHANLAAAQYVVEVDDSQMFDLWQKHAETSQTEIFYNGQRMDGPRLTWDEGDRGSQLITIGKVLGRPVCVNPRFAKLNGVLVAFIECTSLIKDYDMVEKWTKKYLPNVKMSTDYRNFSNVAHTIKKQTESEKS